LIDTSVFNAARITKLYGTVARKGDDCEMQPHRKSSYVLNDSAGAVSSYKLQWLADQAPATDPVKRDRAGSAGKVKVEAYLKHYGKYKGKKEDTDKDGNPRTLYFLKDGCVFNPEHGRQDAAIVQDKSGLITYWCFHNGCIGRTWRQAREIISGDASLVPFVVGGGPRPIEPEGFTVEELMMMDFPDPVWVVNEFLPEGLTLLCGKPKQGKSFLALNVGVSIGYGGKALSSIDVSAGKVLYLALEDSPRRLKSRLADVLQGGDPPQRVHLYTRWPNADDDGLDLLDKWLAEHKDTVLVIVDTLEKFRAKRKHKNIYAEDYEALSGLHELAGKYSAAILVIHHLRKTEAEDWIDTVSGSTGLSGAADTIMRLVRARGAGQVDATLNIVGRDIEEKDLALQFDRDTKSWSLVGDAEEVARTRKQQEILDLLIESKEPLAPKEIADILEKPAGKVRKSLYYMKSDGLVLQPEYGKYIAAKSSDHIEINNKTTIIKKERKGNSGNSGTLGTVGTPKGKCSSVPGQGTLPGTLRSAKTQASTGSVPSILGKPPNPLKCHGDKCSWLQWPDKSDKWDAVCVLAAMTGHGVNVPDKKNKSRMTDKIVRMSFCPLPEYEKRNESSG
jgi:hypothetical protein